jgi:hypothetical protein
MITPNGILGFPTGPIGPTYFRRNAAGDLIAVPRARRDAKTKEQIEQRRRLDLIMKLGSQVYLGALKPFFTVRHKYMHALSLMAKLTLSNYSETYGIPRFKLPPGPFPWDFFPVTGLLYNTWPTEIILTDWTDPHFETTDEMRGFLVYDNPQIAYPVPPGIHFDTDVWVPPLQGTCTGDGCIGCFWVTREILGKQTLISKIFEYHYRPWR